MQRDRIRVRHRGAFPLDQEAAQDLAGGGLRDRVGEVQPAHLLIGRDPGGQWVAETECIVFDISLAEGLEIACRFEQNAVVFVERGKAPRLEFPEE